MTLKMVLCVCCAGDLLELVKRDFGSVDNMKTQLSTVTTAIQGSGWGWLGYNSTTDKLQIATCANQDPLQATTGNPESLNS